MTKPRFDDKPEHMKKKCIIHMGGPIPQNKTPLLFPREHTEEVRAHRQGPDAHPAKGGGSRDVPVQLLHHRHLNVAVPLQHHLRRGEAGVRPALRLKKIFLGGGGLGVEQLPM